MVDSTDLRVDVDGDDVLVMLDGDVDPAHLAAEINRRAHAAGIVLSELHYRRADLEARYLNLVNQVNSPQGGHIMIRAFRSEWILLNRTKLWLILGVITAVFTAVATALVLATAEPLLEQSDDGLALETLVGAGGATMAVIFSIAFAHPGARNLRQQHRERVRTRHAAIGTDVPAPTECR